jgi:hypothetical protein
MGMKRAMTFLGITLSTAALILPAPGRAQQRPQAPQPPSAQQQGSASVPVYKPPLRGAPRGRIGGGTRGAGGEAIVLSVLAPDHAGLTASEQPALYWYISKPTPHPVELTLVDPRAAEPLLDVTVPGPIQAGLHSVRLAERGIRLERGVPYRWYVAVVEDPGRRSKDILTGGVVERVDLSPEVQARLAQAGTGEAAVVYAEAGLWYDALTAVSAQIEAAPGDPRPERQRQALLAQVGLPDVGP